MAFPAPNTLRAPFREPRLRIEGRPNDAQVPVIRGEKSHRMFSLIQRYASWLHTRWPAGTVEKLPVTDEQGRTSVPGVRIVGDLTGIPLLKFSSNTGARAVRAILQ